jgi:hypothetical protein
MNIIHSSMQLIQALPTECMLPAGTALGVKSVDGCEG